MTLSTLREALEVTREHKTLGWQTTESAIPVMRKATESLLRVVEECEKNAVPENKTMTCMARAAICHKILKLIEESMK